jgi:hypothetical protein
MDNNKVQKWQKAQINSTLPQWWERKPLYKKESFMSWMVVNVLTTVFRFTINYLIKK